MQKDLRSILSTEKNQIIIEQDPVYFLNYNYICICMCILKKVRTETDHLETILSGTGVRNGRGRVKGFGCDSEPPPLLGLAQRAIRRSPV